jgi:hypothetical protein
LRGHTFRATGITAYLLNGGSIEGAQAIAAHESPRTTKVTYGLSDRGGSKCRLTVEVQSATYHSAWVPDKVGVCRRNRDDLLRLLGR